MKEQVSLRPVRPHDEPFLLTVYASVRADELAQTAWTPDEKADFLRMQFNAQKQYYEANYREAEFFVIMVRGEPAGRLYLHRTGSEIRIMDIALLPQMRRKGIGRWLLTKIQEEAAGQGKTVGIHVEIFNPALRLYESLGFVRVAERGVYYFLTWMPTQAVPSSGS